MEGKASLLLQDQVQCYNPHMNYWEHVTPVQEARAKAAAVEHNRLLYVSGKRNIVLNMFKLDALFEA